MDIKSLMIGDWVYDTLSQTDIKVNRGCFEINPLNGICYAENLIPIPLTGEILEKNGWIKDGYFYRAKDGSYIQLGQLFEHATFSCRKDGINREVITSPSILKYVHQLQHALRLCGISKEIEL